MLDSLTGLIPVAMGAGIVMKVTERVLPSRRHTRRGKGYRRSKRSRMPTSQGNFSNIGL